VEAGADAEAVRNALSEFLGDTEVKAVPGYPDMLAFITPPLDGEGARAVLAQIERVPGISNVESVLRIYEPLTEGDSVCVPECD
jgi:hypothetical protein